LDYRKIIAYLIIILAVLGYLYKTKQGEKNRAERAEKFANVYSGTSLMAELYRNDEAKFIEARDSIYQVYNFNADSVEAFRNTFRDREEEWNEIWIMVDNKTDSLIAHFRANQIDRGSDSANIRTDSTLSK